MQITAWVKINVDVALNSSRSALAIVARNHHGEVIYVWGKRHQICIPAQTEAEALLWVVHLAIQERWNFVIFEGDAKNCFDAITCSEHIPDWLTSTTISNICCLSSCLSVC